MGGYTILVHSKKNARLLFDHAPLGFQSTGGHGHADALSIWMSIDGHPLFVDWGTYRYNGDPKYREQARSTMSHNTITIDNIDQSEMTGPFYGGTEQNVKLSTGMLKTVSLKLITMDIKNHSVCHHRRIRCNKDGFVIEDFLTNNYQTRTIS